MIDDDHPEPDSIETTTINLLVEAMCDGDEHLAAHDLRLLSVEAVDAGQSNGGAVAAGDRSPAGEHA
jgi:hypothetical protein